MADGVAGGGHGGNERLEFGAVVGIAGADEEGDEQPGEGCLLGWGGRLVSEGLLAELQPFVVAGLSRGVPEEGRADGHEGIEAVAQMVVGEGGVAEPVVITELLGDFIGKMLFTELLPQGFQQEGFDLIDETEAEDGSITIGYDDILLLTVVDVRVVVAEELHGDGETDGVALVVYLDDLGIETLEGSVADFHRDALDNLVGEGQGAYLELGAILDTGVLEAVHHTVGGGELVAVTVAVMVDAKVATALPVLLVEGIETRGSDLQEDEATQDVAHLDLFGTAVGILLEVYGRNEPVGHLAEVGGNLVEVVNILVSLLCPVASHDVPLELV